MNALKHLIINLIFGFLILLLFFKQINFQYLLVIVLSGFLIDVDHIFNEIYKKTIFKPKKFVRYWFDIANKYTGELYLFHTYEFFLLILILSLYNKLFLFIFIGLVIHFIADGITNNNYTRSFKWVKNYSVILYLFKKKVDN